MTNIKPEQLKVCTVDGCGKPLKGHDTKYCSMHRGRLTRTGRLDKKSTAERIEDNIERITESGCWIWVGCVCVDGYGRFRVDGKKMLAHRASYEVVHGEIPKGKIACHRCDNPSCVNPDHIFIGTHLDNVRDCITKGRFKGWDNSPWISRSNSNGGR